MRKKFIFFILLGVFLLLIPNTIFSQSNLDKRTANNLNIPFVDLVVRSPANNQETALSIQILLLIAILTLSPSIIILTTSFLRISIVFDFIKRSLSLQTSPPNQVILGVSLFLTLFIMWPTFSDIYKNAYTPYQDGKLNTVQFLENSEKPLRGFMYRQMAGKHDNIAMFMKMANLERPANLSEVPTYVLIPAFILNELTLAFKIGILLFLPFIVIDLVIASILMSMGMIMLPPVMISMPFKIALFVFVDGWTLLTQQLVLSFR